MTFSLIQANAAKADRVTPSSPYTAGSLVVACACGDGSTPTGSDGVNNWAQLGNIRDSGAGQNFSWYYAWGVAAGSPQFVVANIGGFPGVGIMEFGGVLQGSDPLDVKDAGLDTTCGTGANNYTTNSVSPGVTAELLVSVYNEPSGYTAANAGTGWNDALLSSFAGAGCGVDCEWKTGGSGSQSATYTTNVGSGTVGLTFIGAFKAPAAAAAGALGFHIAGRGAC